MTVRTGYHRSATGIQPSSYPDEFSAGRAACTRADPDMFTPEHTSQFHEAVSVCLTCPIIDACLQRGKDTHATGVYGAVYLDGGRVVADGFRERRRGRKHKNQVTTEASENSAAVAV